MKKFIKVMAFSLLVLQVLPMLASCNDPASSGGETTTDDIAETTPADTTGDITDGGVKITEDGKLKYTVIRYAPDPDSVTFEAIKKLRDKIKELTGEMPELKPDYSTAAKPADPNTYEILVGETNYSQSAEVLATVNYGDYKIAAVGNKIVIAAYAGSEVSRAVNYLTGTMLRETDDNGNMKLEVREYEYRAKRYISSVTINGVDLSEYSIVYSTVGTTDDYNLANAKLLRQAFSEKAGYILPIIKDTDDCKTAKKILVGTTFNGSAQSQALPKVETLSYKFATVGNDFCIMGGGLLSNQIAVNEFISDNLYARPSDGKVNITDYEGTFRKVSSCPKTEGAEFRVMTYNIMAQWTNWGGDYMPVDQRYEAFRAVIDIYSPDVVGLQEVSEQWSTKIQNELGDQYAYVYRETPDGKFVNLSTIIYKKEKLEVVDKGLQYFTINGPNQIRLVTWAIFKDKETGKQFAFFNTHWMFQENDGSNTQRESHSIENAEIINKVMADHPSVKYAFSTADYNTTLEHTYMHNFLKNANLVNSLDIAKNAGTLMNEVGGCGTLGASRENNTGGGSIDNIFVTNNMKVLRHETILWNLIEHVSDHSPKYADIVLGD